MDPHQVVQQILDVVQQINDLFGWILNSSLTDDTIGHLHDQLKETPKQPHSKPLSALLDGYLNTRTGQKWSCCMSIKLGCTSIRLSEEPEGVELQPARRARMRGQAWQGVRGRMEKVWGAAREEENQARGELRKYQIYCGHCLGHFHLLEGKDRGDLETGPGPWTASPAREAFNRITLVIGPLVQWAKYHTYMSNFTTFVYTWTGLEPRRRP